MNIIITGAGRGLGLELVKAFSEEPDNHIIAISRNIRRIDHLVTSGRQQKLLFSTVTPYSFDLVHGDYSELAAFVNLHFTRVDILINNAGLLINKPFEELKTEDYQNMMDTNVRSVVLTIQTLLPKLGKGSHIVNISSMGGYQGSVKFKGLSLYSASKGAVSILTECLAEEFKEKGIFVNALALGSVQTEMLEEAFPGYQAPVTARDMATFVSNFAKSGHCFYNGKVLPVALTTP